MSLFIPRRGPEGTAGRHRSVDFVPELCFMAYCSPCPRASFDSEDFKGRIAFIRTVEDQDIPYDVQTMMIEETGVEGTIKDMEVGHSPCGSLKVVRHSGRASEAV